MDYPKLITSLDFGEMMETFDADILDRIYIR